MFRGVALLHHMTYNGARAALQNNYPIENFPAMEAITYFDKALAVARSGNLIKANQAIEKHTALHKKTEKNSVLLVANIFVN